MPQHILFIQGGGEGAHDAWDNKLADSLGRELGAGYTVRYPRMPNEGDPSYAAWRTAIETEIDALGGGAILVGHSIGGTILIHALAHRTPKRKLGAVLLIAPPFVGEGGWPGDPDMDADLASLPTDVPVLLYHGTADTDVPFAHMALYAKAIPHATTRALSGRDHQLHNDLKDVAEDIRKL
jgi:predicted alpha/beta hydrolase family esterase